MELMKENRFCSFCMEVHEQVLIEEKDITIFKGEEVEYLAQFYLCKNTDETIMTEEQLNNNSKKIKDAYRKKMGLLTSAEIKDIRNKYGVSQKELSQALDWGEKTITRYESHQVQDKAHNQILNYIKENPLNLYDCINENKDKLSENSYKKISKAIKEHLPESSELSLRNSILVDYNGNESNKYQGNKRIDLDKTVEIINYISSHVKNLFTVKLMKMLWYSDNLFYKKFKTSLTGMQYFKETYGGLPKSYDKIILLDGINSITEVFSNGCSGKRFLNNEGFVYKSLNEEEKKIIDRVIEKLGSLDSKEIVERMHNEKAYMETKANYPISFEYAKYLEL